MLKLDCSFGKCGLMAKNEHRTSCHPPDKEGWYQAMQDESGMVLLVEGLPVVLQDTPHHHHSPLLVSTIGCVRVFCVQIYEKGGGESERDREPEPEPESQRESARERVCVCVCARGGEREAACVCSMRMQGRDVPIGLVPPETQRPSLNL
jgi:hypothetical protein